MVKWIIRLYFNQTSSAISNKFLCHCNCQSCLDLCQLPVIVIYSLKTSFIAIAEEDKLKYRQNIHFHFSFFFANVLYEKSNKLPNIERVIYLIGCPKKKRSGVP